MYEDPQSVAMIGIAHEVSPEAIEQVESLTRGSYARDPMELVPAVGAVEIEICLHRFPGRRFALCGNYNFLLRIISSYSKLHD